MNALAHLFEAFHRYQIKVSRIRCAEITLDSHTFDEETDELVLQVQRYARWPEQATEEQKAQFWHDLNFEFSYGNGELAGIIWLDDGRWLEMVATQGRDSWTLRYAPEVPTYLRARN
jgi:hypothetical protein